MMMQVSEHSDSHVVCVDFMIYTFETDFCTLLTNDNFISTVLTTLIWNDMCWRILYNCMYSLFNRLN